jgi:hypothetical protein
MLAIFSTISFDEETVSDINISCDNQFMAQGNISVRSD